MRFRERFVVLLLLLSVFAGLKLTYAPGLGPYGADGNYYFQVARHVAEGRGLLTSVSLYHQGLRRMPQETSIYPLWPLVLGHFGRTFGLLNAVNWLPRSIYILDLIVLYWLSIRMARQAWGPSAELPFARFQFVDFGHLMVLLLGSNSLFFTSTTFPYTEGTCFLFVFAALLALTFLDSRPLLSASLAGLFAGLAYLTRTQMLSLIVACLIILLTARGRSIGRSLRVAAFAAALLLTVSPWLLFLRSFVKPFRPAVLLDFSAYRETPEIPPFDQLLHMGSVGELVLDRVRGFAIAWDALSDFSFFALFGAAAGLVPIAVAVRLWLVRGRKGGDGARSGAAASVAAWTGGIVFAMLLTFHSAFFLPWFFGYRHGLPFFLAIMVSAGFLLSLRRPILTGVAVAAIAISVVTGSSDLGIREARVLKIVGPGAEYLAAARFLDSVPRPPVVIVQEAQLMSVYSRANFHWIACHDSPEITRAMLKHLDIDYLLVEERRRNCAFVQGMGDVLELDRVVGPHGHRMFVLRPRAGG